MAYSKKTWKDRITEYPNRRELTHSDSSTELVTVARSEGTISQEGDAFSAQNMNDLEGRIDSEFSAVDQNLQEINDNLNGFTFYPAGDIDLVASVSDDSYYTDANGKYVLADSPTGESLIDDITYKSLASNEDLRGKVGADTVSPFSKKLVLKNLKVYSGYGNIGANGTSCQYYLELDVSSYNLLKIKNLTNSTANAKCGLTLTDIDTSTTIYSKVNQAVTNFSTDVDISSVNNLQIQLSCYMRYEYAGERSQIDELDFL